MIIKLFTKNLLFQNLILHKLTQVPSILLRRSANFTLSFAGVKAAGLKLQPLNFIGRGNVDIIIDSLGVLKTMVE